MSLLKVFQCFILISYKNFENVIGFPFKSQMLSIDSFPCHAEALKVNSNYGHDDFSIGLLRDTRPHVEYYDVIYRAKHPYLWNHARFFHLQWPMRAQNYIKQKFCNIFSIKQWKNIRKFGYLSKICVT